MFYISTSVYSFKILVCMVLSVFHLSGNANPFPVTFIFLFPTALYFLNSLEPQNFQHS